MTLSAFMVGPPTPRYMFGYGSQTNHGGTATQTGTVNRVFLHACYVPRTCVVDEIAVELTAAGGAATSFRVGLYTPAAATPFSPAAGTLAFTSGDTDANQTGRVSASISSLRLYPGFVWAAVVAPNNTFAFRRYPTTPVYFADASGEFLGGSYYDSGGVDLDSPAPTSGSLTASATANFCFALRVASWG